MSGFALVLAVVFLLVLGGLALLVLTGARLDLREAEQAWLRARLAAAAQSAATLALQHLADADEDPRASPPPDPGQPHRRWSGDWTDPEGVRVEVHLVDAQHRFDLNNLPAAGEEPGPRDAAVRALVEILRLHGDLASVGRVDVLRQALGRQVDPARDGTSNEEARFRSWEEVAAVPGIGMRYLDDITGGHPGWTEHRPPLPEVLALLPAPARNRPVPVNLNTAAPETLHALVGRDGAAAVDRWLAIRVRTPFATVADAAAAGGLPAEALPVIEPWLTTTSSFFEIEASAEFQGIRRRIHALVRRHAGGRVEVLQWTVAP